MMETVYPPAATRLVTHDLDTFISSRDARFAVIKLGLTMCLLLACMLCSVSNMCMMASESFAGL